jgi:hypothetical protein
MPSFRSILPVLIWALPISARCQHSGSGKNYSLPQARLWRLSFTGTSTAIKRFHRDITDNVPLDTLQTRYGNKSLFLDTTLLVIQDAGPQKTHYLAGTPGQGYKEIKALNNSRFQPGRWVYSTQVTAYASKNSVYAYRLSAPLTQYLLPHDLLQDPILAPALTTANTRSLPPDEILNAIHDQLLFEAGLVTMIKDTLLDPYNRGLLTALRQNYLQHLHAGKPIPQHAELLAAQ